MTTTTHDLTSIILIPGANGSTILKINLNRDGSNENICIKNPWKIPLVNWSDLLEGKETNINTPFGHILRSDIYDIVQFHIMLTNDHASITQIICICFTEFQQRMYPLILGALVTGHWRFDQKKMLEGC